MSADTYLVSKSATHESPSILTTRIAPDATTRRKYKNLNSMCLARLVVPNLDAIDFAAEERGCKRCGHGHATKRRNEASWQRSAAVEGTEGSAGFWIRMHDLDSGVAVGANQAIHLEGLRSRVALIG